MKNSIIQDNRARANALIESLKAKDTALNSSQSVAYICGSQRFLHYMAAKKLGFPVSVRRERRKNSDSSGHGENENGSKKSRKNRSLFNNKNFGGLDHGDQIEI